MAAPFCWYELMTSDTAAAGAFYEKVVGWTTRAEGGGHYIVFLTPSGAMVGGMMGVTPEMAAQGARPGWIGYVYVPDVEASAAKAASLGGSIMKAAEDMPGIGRFAVAADPFGAAFILFSPADASTAPGQGEGPGFVGWRELMAGDLGKAWAFYSALFGWTKGDDHDMGPMGAYRLFKTGGMENVGGMMTKPAGLPASFWTYYFNVAGIRGAADRLTAAGGQIMNGPMQVPGGDWIVQAMDPQGAMFALTSKTE